MTFDKLKFELKRNNTIGVGTVTFYVVPNDLRDTVSMMELPHKREVKVSINKHGKRILDFVGGIGDTNSNKYFFEDEIDLATAHSTKLLLRVYNRILEKKSEFEIKSNILYKVEKYSVKYPELFV